MHMKTANSRPDETAITAQLDAIYGEPDGDRDLDPDLAALQAASVEKHSDCRGRLEQSAPR